MKKLVLLTLALFMLVAFSSTTMAAEDTIPGTYVGSHNYRGGGRNLTAPAEITISAKEGEWYSGILDLTRNDQIGRRMGRAEYKFKAKIEDGKLVGYNKNLGGKFLILSSSGKDLDGTCFIKGETEQIQLKKK